MLPTIEEVCRKIQAAIGKYDELLTLVKLTWFGRVSVSSGLAKTILQDGQEWTLSAQLGQLGQDGKGLLRIHLWCPDDLPRLYDRIEYSIETYSTLFPLKYQKKENVMQMLNSLHWICNFVFKNALAK